MPVTRFNETSQGKALAKSTPKDPKSMILYQSKEIKDNESIHFPNSSFLIPASMQEAAEADENPTPEK